MKTIHKLISIATLLILFSCSSPEDNSIEKLIKARNNYNKEQVASLLTEDFVTVIGRTKYNREEFLNKIDSNRIKGIKILIDTLFLSDSITKTIEPFYYVSDSIIGLNEMLICHCSYILKDNKIKSITLDSITNVKEYRFEENLRYNAVSLFIDEEYPELSKEEINKDHLKYFIEFSHLNNENKERLLKFGRIMGTYYCENPSYYNKIEIVGTSSAFIYLDMILKLKVAASYIIDGNYIKMESDHGTMLFKIGQDGNLYGSGIYKGKFEKVY